MPQIADNIRKVAVTRQDYQTQFIEFDQTKPLPEVIQEIANGWSLGNTDQLALQFEESEKQTYITEENRLEIKNGSILKVGPLPEVCAGEILQALKSKDKAEVSYSLRKLSIMAADVTFVVAFIGLQGLEQVKDMVKTSQCKEEDLGYLYKSLFDLVDNQTVTWEQVEPDVIQTIATFCCRLTPNINPQALQSALDILDDVVSNGSPKESSLVEKEVTPNGLVGHLSSDSVNVQRSAIALINALFSTARPEVQKKHADELQTKSLRSVIFERVIKGKPGLAVGPQMAHQLYILQCHMLNQMAHLKDTPVDITDPMMEKEAVKLLTTRFEGENDTIRRKAEQFKKLGFRDSRNPLQDFTRTPPGQLGLRLMVNFAQQHPDDYSRIVLENSCRSDEYDLPFGQACIELAIVLCKILNVGETPRDDCQLYQPMFFTHDRPFEELFCCCVALFNTTWKDMRATMTDLPKVTGVVEEQIMRALVMQPSTFETLKQKLSGLKYAEILNIWQEERRSKEESEAVAKPIQELRARIKPEMMSLIRQQRLNYLVEGSMFSKPTRARRGDKMTYMYIRLSSNHKVLCYGDCQEGEKPTPDQLSNKLSVVDVKTVLVGKDCPHVKDKNKGGNKQFNTQLPISIIPEENVCDPLNLFALSEEDFNMWIDGLNALMGDEMQSALVSSDLNTLLNMEIKLRLLETEGIKIPENPPAIPPDPPNYDFLFKL